MGYNRPAVEEPFAGTVLFSIHEAARIMWLEAVGDGHRDSRYCEMDLRRLGSPKQAQRVASDALPPLS